MMRNFFLYSAALFLLLIAGLVILRIFARRSYRDHGRLTPTIAFIQALLFFVYGGFPTFYLPKTWPDVDAQPWLHGIGLAMLVIGLGFLFSGIFQLSLRSSVGRGAPVLKWRGMYSVSRNPQALACGLYVLGFAILWPSGYAAGWALLYPILIHTMILTEEEHLARLYAQDYLDYCQQVPRYLGRRKPRSHSDD